MIRGRDVVLLLKFEKVSSCIDATSKFPTLLSYPLKPFVFVLCTRSATLGLTRQREGRVEVSIRKRVAIYCGGGLSGAGICLALAEVSRILLHDYL